MILLAYNNFKVGRGVEANFPGEEERGENDGDSTSRMT